MTHVCHEDKCIQTGKGHMPIVNNRQCIVTLYRTNYDNLYSHNIVQLSDISCEVTIASWIICTCWICNFNYRNLPHFSFRTVDWSPYLLQVQNHWVYKPFHRRGGYCGWLNLYGYTEKTQVIEHWYWNILRLKCLHTNQDLEDTNEERGNPSEFWLGVSLPSPISPRRDK